MLSKDAARKKRHARIRKIVSGTALRPRVVVYKSNLKTYAQVVDDLTGHVLIGMDSTVVKDSKGKKPVEICQEFGKLFAEKLTGKKISEIVFDRNGYRYHGRVKALATGLREAGIKF